MARRGPGALPGFGLALGWTLTWLSLIVLVPLATLVWKSTDLGWARFWALGTSKRALASYQLTFGTALAAATVNLLLGTIVAWVLVRYRFWGQSVVDALVDIPFALPTAVSGLAITAALAPRGWIGSVLADHGVRVVYTRYGITIALIFTGLPFVVRSVQPLLQQLEPELEEAATMLGASRWQTVTMLLNTFHGDTSPFSNNVCFFFINLRLFTITTAALNLPLLLNKFNFVLFFNFVTYCFIF